MIHKRHDGAAAFDKSTPGVHIGDVGELIIRDVQQACQFLPIRGRLIQHDEKFRVRQHGAGCVGLQQVFDILTDSRAASLVFSHSFPQGEQEIGAVLMLEQQVDLINIDPGVALQPTVADDAIEDAVQHHQHPHRQKLLAQIPDIVTEDTGIGVHIGGLGKGVETAVCKQLNGQRHILCFLFRLAEQLGVEVLQGGDRAVIAAADIVPVHLRGAAVDDGFFLGRQLACPNELFTEGEQELGFQHHGVLSVPIALLHIHGVDMVGRCGGDVDDLTAQSFDEGAVLRLRVDDDDIVLRGQRQ